LHIKPLVKRRASRARTVDFAGPTRSDVAVFTPSLNTPNLARSAALILVRRAFGLCWRAASIKTHRFTPQHLHLQSRADFSLVLLPSLLDYRSGVDKTRRAIISRSDTLQAYNSFLGIDTRQRVSSATSTDRTRPTHLETTPEQVSRIQYRSEF